MTLKNTPTRYAGPLIALHWLTLLLLIAVYATMELRGLAPKGTPAHDQVKTWHYMLGLLVLGTVVLRALLRMLAGPAPGVTPPMPMWQERSARLVHLLLYLFMATMPVLGWLILSAKGAPVPFFGLALPPLTAPDPALAREIKDLHEALATVGYVLIGLHAAAALVHHYLTRDNTLRRMLPGGR